MSGQVTEDSGAGPQGGGIQQEAGEPGPSAGELAGELAETQRELAAAREALDAAERKRQIDRELWSQGAIDIETASLLTEAAVAGMKEADVRAAVQELRRRKPFLFRSSHPRDAGGVMAGAPGPQGDGLETVAAEARASGDRRALLRYLRLRREG